MLCPAPQKLGINIGTGCGLTPEAKVGGERGAGMAGGGS